MPKEYILTRFVQILSFCILHEEKLNMKKKIELLLVVATMAMSILAGCGKTSSNLTGSTAGEGSGTAKDTGNGGTITVSEMLDNVLEENGGHVYIYEDEVSGRTFDDIISNPDYGTANANIYRYDGTNIGFLSCEYDYDASGIKNMGKEVGSTGDAYFASVTRETNTLKETADKKSTVYDKYQEYVKYDDEKLQPASVTVNDEGLCALSDDIVFHDDFYHIENGGISYMVFHEIKGTSGKSNGYIFIEDTDYTKDKTVVTK